ncbi:membrane-bound lytic murein transglycosylase D [Syntrophus gentianae]|uniref:Membrane-bound lytic murein transglycosylase D n=1 Tax=Syntrophus gentianae TaxID=43775 RepID=A0A1H7XD57_9BACT|nr:LysM peptidoglycan-binding domain-containing protein [Syntrophus gentianae]SEM31623.1 membrane-bound lytic murein transglycosylase D [Syntrophus gentianae]
MKKAIQYTMTSLFFIFLLSFSLVQSVCAQPQNENENKDGKVTKSLFSFSFQNDLQSSGTKTQNSNEKDIQKKKASHIEVSSRASAQDSDDEEGKEDERDLMEEALAYLNSSQKFWEQGDIEKALDFLDQAYTLLLETDGDLEIARQKDDLRLLISKRLLAIYSSSQTRTKGNRSEIPIVMNPDVEREIRSFQTYERDFFISSYQRSGIYRASIQKELKKAGLPEELVWLPLVESGFKIGALSKARALGLWQFIPSTGYKYGLNRDEWIDERMNADKSTQAAISYLKELHGMFGDWLTVLAAYNSGEGRVMRVISRQHINYLDRFWDLYHQLPNETARYVPRFLATLHIIRDPEKYGFDLKADNEQKAPSECKKVKSYKPMKLQDVAFYTGVSEDVLNGLNSELRHRITPDKEYDLQLPVEAVEKYAQIVDSIPQSERPTLSLLSSNSSGRDGHRSDRISERRTSNSNYLSHRIKRGESLGSIAKRYKTSPRTLAAYNSISSKKDLKPGQKINIPTGKSKKLAKKAVPSAEGDKNSNDRETRISYKVKKGDSLASLARRFGTSEAEIKKLNRIKGRNLTLGKVIKISRDSSDEDDNSKAAEQKKEGTRKSKKRVSQKESEKTYLVKKG